MSKKILDHLGLWEGYSVVSTMVNAQASPVSEDPAKNSFIEHEPFDDDCACLCVACLRPVRRQTRRQADDARKEMILSK